MFGTLHRSHLHGCILTFNFTDPLPALLPGCSRDGAPDWVGLPRRCVRGKCNLNALGCPGAGWLPVGATVDTSLPVPCVPSAATCDPPQQQLCRMASFPELGTDPFVLLHPLPHPQWAFNVIEAERK